ncbi:DNA (cytosine-5-)-methyltransferase [Planctomyces sp. SH-PL62]|uniref:DNA (cytosine-5-)-methyltransferase n=1 Tax=Planctomyces sp. SH-PL62 TaxID=1636152 RepID=UPI0008387B29|nr:DNA (cytosine-5-)-methyltransferase [Planctomyces sp. SH-PL62]
MAPDRSGWTPHPSERRDFWNRIRAFPSEVVRWRKRFLKELLETPGRFTLTSGLPSEQLTERLDSGISHLREVARILAELYGSPDLGNKKDPTDELVYILLARHTREGAYQTAFESLKRRFPTWDQMLDAPRDEVERLVYSGGLSGKKTLALYSALGKLRETFGSCTLEPARDWSDERLEAFLCELPEIQRKSAYCVMMYAFGRLVFPADTHVGRVLSRIGPYRELGLSLDGLDHKKLQRELADLIPPNLRYSLHVNLVEHGRTVCRSPKPLCGTCEIRNLCQYYRKAESERAMAAESPTVMDLFAGGGGLSEGFSRAGFKTLAAVEMDEMAARTYRLNHPGVPDERVIEQDIRTLATGDLKRLAGKSLDVLAGAPPCQGFSSVGFRSKKSLLGYRPQDDDRNHLYETMVEAALVLRPKLFLMENVPGMKSAKREDHSFLDTAARLLEQKGTYQTEVWRLNASAFGVPQDRIRMFLVASRLKVMPLVPTADYQDTRSQHLDHDALPPVGLSEAIFDLPERAAGEGKSTEGWSTPHALTDPRFRRYLTKFGILRASRLLYQHTVRYHNPNDLELYAMLRPGEDSIHALERHGRSDLMRYRRDVFDDKYARLRGDRPCKTIVAHLAKDGNGYIHPTQVRSISLREAARVQSFHDGYIFCGSPSEQWVQLGNAVPPVLAEAIARSFRRALERS